MRVLGRTLGFSADSNRLGKGRCPRIGVARSLTAVLRSPDVMVVRRQMGGALVIDGNLVNSGLVEDGRHLSSIGA